MDNKSLNAQILMQKIGKAFVFFFLLFLVSFLGNNISCFGQNPQLALNDSNDSITDYQKYATFIYGAEPNPTEEPIGGGKGYRKIITKYDYLVKTRDELLSSLKSAKSGDVIYIVDTAKVDLTDSPTIIIHGGVTLAGGRGKNNSDGALLFSNNLKTFPMFKTGGEHVHISGLRFLGPDTARRTEQMKQLVKEGHPYSIPNSRAIQSSYSYTEIDNCEIWGWSHAAIFLSAPVEGNKCDSNYIHNNYIHHNQRQGLGYGVALDNSEALIEANVFDWCRHGIAGTGRSNTSYEARYNIVLENFNGHSFDMHGGKDRHDSTNIAGNKISIHHNTFKVTKTPSIVIRGIPETGAEIYNNLFYTKDISKAVKQVNAEGKMNVFNNKLGFNGKVQ